VGQVQVGDLARIGAVTVDGWHSNSIATVTDPGTASLRTDLRALPRPVRFLLAGSFVNRFGSFVLPFLVLYLTHHRGYTAAQAGLALSAYGVGSASAAAAGGVRADHVGRRATIALSMYSSAIVMLALSRAGSLAAVVPLTALAGLAAESYRPASSALLADLVPQGRRVTAFAAYRLAINLGFAAGPAVAGLLAERSFLGVFVGDAATSAIFGTLAVLLLPSRPETHHETPPGSAGAVRTILADRAFLALLATSVIIGVIYFQQEAALPLQVIADGHSTAVYGALISLNGLVVILLELPLTTVTRRLPPRRVIAAGVLLTGIGFGTTALATSAPALAATVVVWTLGEITAAPVSSAYVADISPPHMRGRYAGAFGMSFSLAQIVGPAAGTSLYAASPDVLWGGCVVLGVLASALMLSPASRPRYATTASRSTSAA
jgi:MFS family permease